MPANLPYLASYKNVGTLFERIASAKIPDAFTHGFLTETLGLKGSNDRALISLMKSLGFVDQSSKPTPEYGKLKNKALAKTAIAEGVKTAYAPLFKANEEAHRLEGDALKGLIAQVAGTDEAATAKIYYTFVALTKVADFSGEAVTPANAEEKHEADAETPPPFAPKSNGATGSPEFHFNIQIHLPSNATEETYLNIFSAVRKSFK